MRKLRSLLWTLALIGAAATAACDDRSKSAASAPSGPPKTENISIDSPDAQPHLQTLVRGQALPFAAPHAVGGAAAKIVLLNPDGTVSAMQSRVPGEWAARVLGEIEVAVIVMPPEPDLEILTPRTLFVPGAGGSVNVPHGLRTHHVTVQLNEARSGQFLTRYQVVGPPLKAELPAGSVPGMSVVHIRGGAPPEDEAVVRSVMSAATRPAQPATRVSPADSPATQPRNGR